MLFCSLGDKLCPCLYVGFVFGPNSDFESVGINLSANTNASGVILRFFYYDWEETSYVFKSPNFTWFFSFFFMSSCMRQDLMSKGAELNVSVWLFLESVCYWGHPGPGPNAVWIRGCSVSARGTSVTQRVHRLLALGWGETALQDTYGSVNKPHSHPVPPLCGGKKGMWVPHRRVGAGPWQLPGSRLRASPALVVCDGCSRCPAQPGDWHTSRASGNIFCFQPKPVFLICASSLRSFLIFTFSCENVMYLFLQRV